MARCKAVKFHTGFNRLAGDFADSDDSVSINRTGVQHLWRMNLTAVIRFSLLMVMRKEMLQFLRMGSGSTTTLQKIVGYGRSTHRCEPVQLTNE